MTIRRGAARVRSMRAGREYHRQRSLSHMRSRSRLLAALVVLQHQILVLLEAGDAIDSATIRTSGEITAANWTEDALSLHSLGHHRIHVRCPTNAVAVLAVPEWRRPDSTPEQHGVFVTSDPTSTEIILNTTIANVSRRSGAIAFDPRRSTRGYGDQLSLIHI